MAGDTRETPKTPPRGPPPGSTEVPSHVQTPPKIYEVFHAPPSANALPEGSGQNTAGANTGTPSLGEAIKTVRIEDLKQVHLYPCVRESLLMGIGAGFGLGGVRALWGAPIPKAANWAAGSFVFAGIANYEFCLYRRRLERGHMKRATEIMDRKKIEKEEAAKLKREERRKAKEEADKKIEEAKKGWKFW